MASLLHSKKLSYISKINPESHHSPKSTLPSPRSWGLKAFEFTSLLPLFPLRPFSVQQPDSSCEMQIRSYHTPAQNSPRAQLREGLSSFPWTQRPAMAGPLRFCHVSAMFPLAYWSLYSSFNVSNIHPPKGLCINCAICLNILTLDSHLGHFLTSFCLTSSRVFSDHSSKAVPWPAPYSALLVIRAFHANGHLIILWLSPPLAHKDHEGREHMCCWPSYIPGF